MAIIIDSSLNNTFVTIIGIIYPDQSKLVGRVGLYGIYRHIRIKTLEKNKYLKLHAKRKVCPKFRQTGGGRFLMCGTLLSELAGNLLAGGVSFNKLPIYLIGTS